MINCRGVERFYMLERVVFLRLGAVSLLNAPIYH